MQIGVLFVAGTFDLIARLKMLRRFTEIGVAQSCCACSQGHFGYRMFTRNNRAIEKTRIIDVDLAFSFANLTRRLDSKKFPDLVQDR